MVICKKHRNRLDRCFAFRLFVRCLIKCRKSNNTQDQKKKRKRNELKHKQVFGVVVCLLFGYQHFFPFFLSLWCGEMELYMTGLWGTHRTTKPAATTANSGLQTSDYLHDIFRDIKKFLPKIILIFLGLIFHNVISFHFRKVMIVLKL